MTAIVGIKNVTKAVSNGTNEESHSGAMSLEIIYIYVMILKAEWKNSTS